MCTGDNIDTAIAIAVDANIISKDEAYGENRPPYAFMTGFDFSAKIGGLKVIEDPEDKEKTKTVVGSLKEFREIARDLKVLARSSPEHKRMLVTGL
jgi:P-type Ca2+ transporter type 2B